MNNSIRSVLIWILALGFTLSLSVYTRLTGPTKPVRGSIELAGQSIRYKLIRTHNTGQTARIEIMAADPSIGGTYSYRRYKSYDSWVTLPLHREGERLVAYIPSQPPAGKVLYKIGLEKGSDKADLTDEPVIIRFKGAVPAHWLIPHILFMFIAMLLAARAGIEVLAKGPKVYTYAWLTTVALFLGGLVFGPIIQKYAFGAWWTGWPFGHDLTDNKTAVSFLFWVIAVLRLRRHRDKPGWVLLAAVTMFLVYLIPHSLLGSELDYTAAEDTLPAAQ